MKKKKCTFSMDPVLFDKLSKLSEKTGRSKSFIVGQLIDEVDFWSFVQALPKYREVWNGISSQRLPKEGN